MASRADSVLRNFRWRVESTAPTHQRPLKPFRWIDPRRVDSDGSPTTRLFHVQWLDGDDDRDASVTDMVERRAVHRFQLDVLYPREYESMLLQEIVLQDRHDIIKALRDDRLWVGTSAADPLSDIGLKSRTLGSPTEMVDGETNTPTLRMIWECEIWETE